MSLFADTRSRSTLRACLLGLAGMLWIVLPGSVAAQVTANGPASTAMAGGGPAFVYGSQAIFRNPANLALDRIGLIEMSIGHVGVSAGGNLLQFKHYNDLFTSGRTISDAEARNVVDQWFDGAESADLKRVGLAAETVPIAVTHETNNLILGYGLRFRSLGTVGINGGWLDLLLSGTGDNRSLPLHGEFAMMSMTEISVAGARMLNSGDLAIGFAPKIILGNEFVDARLRSTAHITDDAIVHDFDYRVRAAGGLSREFVDGFDLFSSDVFSGGPFRPSFLSTTGVGLGLDFGVTFLPSPGLRLSASITDAGFVRWSGDAQRIEPLSDQFSFVGLEFDIDRVRDEYGGDIGEYFISTVDSLASGTYDQVDRKYGAFFSGLPTAIHFGAAWIAPGGRLVLAGGTSTPVTSSVVQVSTPPELHVGAEYSLGGTVRVPIRAGLFVGGSSALTLGFGFGLHTPRYDVDIGLAASPRTDIVGSGGRYTAAVSAVTLRF
ncbi:MAG: DUF5723 family protein [Rhodothermales bacterium]|nr:DUF5723 family protein [Rhodothermales bacterium]